MKRGRYEVSEYRTRRDKTYCVLCAIAMCRTTGYVAVTHAWHVPAALRALGWRTRHASWVCPQHAQAPDVKPSVRIHTASGKFPSKS